MCQSSHLLLLALLAAGLAGCEDESEKRQPAQSVGNGTAINLVATLRSRDKHPFQYAAVEYQRQSDAIARGAAKPVTHGLSPDAESVTEVVSAAPGEAIVLSNFGRPVEFELIHNGHYANPSLPATVDEIQSMSDEIPGEALERKIWRYVRDNTLHFPPAGFQPWLSTGWATLYSFGWGFCSNVAITYAQLAMTAGYEARIRWLGGHVVPEVKVDGVWQMYDPDLAVYYHKADGTVASVDELVADPGLISRPIGPIFNPGQNDWAYSATVAGIYGSSDDNYTMSVVPDDPIQEVKITLPTGAKLKYPGIWTEPVTGFDDDDQSYQATQFRQARLELPAGFIGSLSIPWVIWDIQGTGRVRLAGREFATASSDLRSFLANAPVAITQVDVVQNSHGLAVIMMINPLWFGVDELNTIQLSGSDVWAISVGTTQLDPANRAPPPVPFSMRKPQACGDGFGNRCDADIDNSGGAIDVTDYALFRLAYGTENLKADIDGSGGPVDAADAALFNAAIRKRLLHVDLDGDGMVTAFDFAIFRTAFGTTRSYGDVDGSGGAADSQDAAVLMSYIGKPAPH